MCVLASVLVVAAHPDDEVLGCGGTLLNHINDGDEVTVLLLSRGRNDFDFSKLESMTGFKYYADRFNPQQFETYSLPLLVESIENVALKCNPDIVYTHSNKDLQIDHRRTLEAVLVAFRPSDKPIKILSFEILSSSEWNLEAFSPNYYNNISDTIFTKLNLLDFYYDEMRPYPHPRSRKGVEIKSQSRGLEVGMVFAEAFEIIRIINK